MLLLVYCAGERTQCRLGHKLGLSGSLQAPSCSSSCSCSTSSAIAPTRASVAVQIKVCGRPMSLRFSRGPPSIRCSFSVTLYMRKCSTIGDPHRPVLSAADGGHWARSGRGNEGIRRSHPALIAAGALLAPPEFFALPDASAWHLSFRHPSGDDDHGGGWLGDGGRSECREWGVPADKAGLAASLITRPFSSGPRWGLRFRLPRHGPHNHLLAIHTQHSERSRLLPARTAGRSIALVIAAVVALRAPNVRVADIAPGADADVGLGAENTTPCQSPCRLINTRTTSLPSH